MYFEKTEDGTVEFTGIRFEESTIEMKTEKIALDFDVIKNCRIEADEVIVTSSRCNDVIVSGSIIICNKLTVSEDTVLLMEDLTIYADEVFGEIDGEEYSCIYTLAEYPKH